MSDDAGELAGLPLSPGHSVPSGQPMVDEQGRPQPPVAGGEVETQIGYLEFFRASFRWKTGDLDAAELNLTLGPSSMTLGGMMKHLAFVEDHWFRYYLQGAERSAPWNGVDWDSDRDWDWNSAASDSPDQIRTLWETSVARSREATNAALADGGLDHLARRIIRQDNEEPNLRWIVAHMNEEYARHLGHADLIRESIDGLVGE
ncbi:mycothiol transferase [Kineosporia succinea]|uniref:Damage-inducible protein DinB n=1 Tax=Kineosporia succinea TaxID=84632 RepID=A0ABT9NZS7_9ACTN|nr:DUF664 domain-containing protein [Kineosporia succinea]MDP9825335.1 hypothetical protein [Kineosporia succinea]